VILKNQIRKIPLINFIKSFFSKIIFILGAISLISIFLVAIYYFSSGMKSRFSPSMVLSEVNENIFDKYLGFNIYKIDDYIINNIYSIKYWFVQNKLENASIIIDQENLYNLELQRKNKINNEKNISNEYSRGLLSLEDKEYKIKLRLKGDRALHWYDKETSSYKIDVRNGDTVWGMEEFSVQKPITRNYIYELIFHKLLKFSDLISLNYFFINLSMNDTNQGVYAVEEGFATELIERNKRRNGPIFGLEEKKGTTYPNVSYDLYSSEFWISNYYDLTSSAFSKLNQLKDQETSVNEIFDLEKWATYFAIIDLTSSLHGALSKSVKLYFNPVNSKFEPIGFDAHYQSNFFEEFLILDFLDLKNKNCSYICEEREWFFRFLKNNDLTLNNEFLKIYLEKLNLISSESFLKTFLDKNIKEIEFYNLQFLSDKRKTDKMFYKGIGDYIFDEEYLNRKAAYIRSRLEKINNFENIEASLEGKKIKFYNNNEFFFKKILEKCEDKTNSKFITSNLEISYKNTCRYLLADKQIVLDDNIFLTKKNYNEFFDNFFEIYGIKKSNNIFELSKNLEIDRNVYIPQNANLIIKDGVNITFLKDVIFLSEGQINFNGTVNKPITIDGINGSGSIILVNNKFQVDNVIFKNLSLPKEKSKILYGGLNIINSTVKIANSEILNSNSEDAINIISSNTNIDSLKVSNTFADAIDIDFGKLNFKNIECYKVNNDCLDVSGAEVEGVNLFTEDVLDKGLSFGESSEGTISKLTFKKNKLAIAVKDGSSLEIDDFNLLENQYDFAVFNKKSEYGKSVLKLTNTTDLENLNFLVGKNNELIANSKLNIKKLENSYIYNLFYNNIN
tara:strand:+ start:853 stop:3393 length:2541 start_codon:yes stop_codon:yes gene_type:complete